MLEDKLLIWRFKRGHRDALRQIYDKYKGDLLKLSIILTGDICYSEDVVQDVFVKLAESYGRISINSNLRNYLITCLINRIRTFRRDCRRHQGTQFDQPVIRTSQVNRPDQWAVLNEQVQRLSDAMAQLPFEQREVVTLRFEAGLAFPKIAGIQNVSISTVQGRYRYGMEKLRSLLNSEVKK
jgi:RNA polymerase sigma factor (sigma-70 family)